MSTVIFIRFHVVWLVFNSRLSIVTSGIQIAFFLFSIPHPFPKWFFRLSFFQPTRTRRRFAADTFSFFNSGVCRYPNQDFPIRYSPSPTALSLSLSLSLSLCLPWFSFSYKFLSFPLSGSRQLKQSAGVPNYFRLPIWCNVIEPLKENWNWKKKKNIQINK